MATMKLSELSAMVQKLIPVIGDAPVVLWDLDTEDYYTLTCENFDIQRMGDGTKRVSIGINSYEDDQLEPGT